MLSHEEARKFYDRLGSGQDRQSFYEDPAVDDLIDHLSPGTAGSVIEFGCGTGRIADMLLTHHLLPDAQYTGFDLSPTMVALAKARLNRFGSRVHIVLTDGEIQLNVAQDSADRFISTYVLDLLTEDDIRSVIAEAHRVLVRGGLLGLVSLTHGFTALSRIFEKIWLAIFRIRPALLGGCRPIDLNAFVDEGWNIQHIQSMTRFGVPSEIVVAKKM